MGLSGAAIATGIGYALPSVVGVIWFCVNRKQVLYVVRPKWRLKTIVDSCVNGSSEMVGVLAFSVVTILFNRILMGIAGSNGVLVFDGANRTAVKMIAKTWLKTAKIKDVGAYFAVSNAKAELSPWDENIEVSSRGYMLGYQDLKDASVNGFFRFLAKLGDNALKMQIVKISFKGK